MEQNKMTPTPWSYEYDDNGFYVIKAAGMPSPYIAATGNESDWDGGNSEAIVKAVNSTYGAGINPEAVSDLRDALQSILLGVTLHPQLRETAEAAIEKAKL